MNNFEIIYVHLLIVSIVRDIFELFDPDKDNNTAQLQLRFFSYFYIWIYLHIIKGKNAEL